MTRLLYLPLLLWTGVIYADDAWQYSMLGSANALRGSAQPYRLEPTLASAAQAYANVLAGTRAQGHFVQGWDVERRVYAYGFTGTLAGPVRRSRIDGQLGSGLGEVIHYGSDPFGGWMKSDGHREALQEPSYDCAGFGYSVNRYTGQQIWVGVFGNSTVSRRIK